METETKIDTKINFNKFNLHGFGGWLILLAIGRIISFIRISLYFFGETLPFIFNGQLKEFITYDSMWGVIILTEALLNLVFLIFIALAVYFCIRQKKAFKNTVIYLLVFDVVAAIVMYLIYLIVPETVEIADVTLISIFKTMFYSLIWIAYMIKSERVRNTYVL